VARLAGVTKAVVSVVLSGRQSTLGVSEVTRRRVLRAVKQLDYQPSPIGRALAHNKSSLVALLGREAYFVFALETIKGIEEVLREKDYSLLTYYDGSAAADQARHLCLALGRRVDGLIVAGSPESARGPNHRRIAALRRAGMPVVQLYRRVFPKVPVVMTDERAAGYLAAQHLLALGHRSIAHVTHDQYRDSRLPGTYSDALQRYEGYVRAMREAGLQPAVVTYHTRTYMGLDYLESVQPAADVLARRGSPFTAVTCYCDYTAIGLMHALRARGRRVPEDISVVGYDDVDAAAMVDPPLTTLAQPLRELGRTAARMVFDLADGKAEKDAIFQPTLFMRGSSRQRKDGCP
jgi:LacI family transcriptional regulator